MVKDWEIPSEKDGIEIILLSKYSLIKYFLKYKDLFNNYLIPEDFEGRIPRLERENAMPHTAVLPLNYIHLYLVLIH
jgi:hypothetical protein